MARNLFAGDVNQEAPSGRNLFADSSITSRSIGDIPQEPVQKMAPPEPERKDPLVAIENKIEADYQGDDALSVVLKDSIGEMKENRVKRLASDYMISQTSPYSGYQTIPEQGYVPPEKGSIGEMIAGAGEAALGVASGAVAEPISGLAGIADIATGGDLESSTETISSIQEALTYEPKTERGVEYQQALGSALAPIGEAIEETGEYLGDATREATGSWVLGGLAESIPESVLTLIGVKGGKRAASPKVKFEKSPQAALSQSAPEISQIRDMASQLYKEIDNAGVVVPKSDYMNLGIKLNNIARQNGYDPNLTPKMKGFLERLEKDYQKGEIKLSDIEQLRKVAQVPANTIDNKTESALGSRMIGAIDEFMDKKGVELSNKVGSDVGKKYKNARNLTSRVKKAELVDEAVFKAHEAASGFENGLRNEIRSILKSKKKRRGFTQDEIKAMQQITRGGSLENTMKRLGRLGYGADQQTNVLASLVGIGAGAQLLGPAGAIGVPVVGQVAARLAKKLGEKNVSYLDATIKAGKNGKEIVKAYIDEVPKNLQNREELTALLLDPSVDISKVKELSKSYRQNRQLINDAAYAADKIRLAQATGALVSTQVLDSENQENK